MANSLTEYLTQMQELTKKNLEILQALNNSFYTKSEHLVVTVDNKQYVIPSFLSLENKLNTLEDNLQNLVNAPKTGDACFNFDGNTQEIQVKGFTNVPCTAFEGLDMENVAGIKNFSSLKNEIFKDFLTPTPYVKIDLAQLPDDIHQVNVKKIAVSNTELIGMLKEASGWIEGDSTLGTSDSVCRPLDYATVVKKLYAFNEGEDYVSYDKLYTLPIRYQLGSGKYSIKQIVNNWTDDNFVEHYELVLDNIIYKVADETIERNLLDGHYLITNNDKVKLLIESVNVSAKTVTVAVENGGFADLCTDQDGSVDLSTLKYFAVGNVNNDKYLNIPLEEDQYVLVFLAPIQRNTLIQSAWKDGLFFNVFGLTNSDGVSYKDYYDNFVTNIGDKLFGIVSMAEKDFVNIGEQEFNNMTKSKPVIDLDAMKVTLINKHMSNSETISELYRLYKEKQEYKTTLANVQNEIDDIKGILSSLSFEDTTNNRTIYTDQLKSLDERKNDLISSITSCIQQISTAATDTDTPVDNPKYHIRGFFDYEDFLSKNSINGHNVIKLEVQYRYKNANRTTGNAESIDTNIFSDWNIMQSEYLFREPEYGTNYKYSYPADTSSVNVPSFNQIDIPISQGETVDIRMRVVYAAGFPYVKCTSDWSEIVNVEFPIELRKNITVLDLIKENNDDTKKEQFKGLLQKMGVDDHVSDTIVDQNDTFLHGPDRIASGFYTAERRVIPLRDKLQSLTDELTAVKDEVFGTDADNIMVTLNDGTHELTINPMCSNTFSLADFQEESIKDEAGVANQTVVLSIQNNSKKNLKLFSLFPGDFEQPVTSSLPNSKFLNDDYCSYRGNPASGLLVPFYVDKGDGQGNYVFQQHQNQWLYFRLKNPFNGEPYYLTTAFDAKTNDILYGGISEEKVTGTSIKNTFGMYIYPHINDWKDVCINSDDHLYYKTIKPGESLQIPISARYYFGGSSNTKFYQKTMSFDIRHSLYEDPINYEFTIRANFNDTVASKQLRKLKKNKYNPVVVN